MVGNWAGSTGLYGGSVTRRACSVNCGAGRGRQCSDQVGLPCKIRGDSAADLHHVRHNIVVVAQADFDGQSTREKDVVLRKVRIWFQEAGDVAESYNLGGCFQRLPAERCCRLVAKSGSSATAAWQPQRRLPSQLNFDPTSSDSKVLVDNNTIKYTINTGEYSVN